MGVYGAVVSLTVEMNELNVGYSKTLTGGEIVMHAAIYNTSPMRLQPSCIAV